MIPETVEPVDVDAPRRDSRIPLKRHETILTGLRDEHAKALQTLQQQHEQALGTARVQLQLMDVADKDPGKFLTALAKADPRYQTLLAPLFDGNGNGHAQPQPPQQPIPQDMPYPDGTLGDGSEGYTQEGLKQLLAWHADHVRKEVVGDLDKRYGPLLQEHETTQAIQAASQRVRGRLQEAVDSWEGFAEAQPDIAKALRADPRLDLFGAYRQVVLPKLKADRDRIRSEVLAELQNKPVRVSGTTPSGSAPPAQVSGDLQSVIRDSIRNLPRD